jgi:plastocyanin
MQAVLSTTHSSLRLFVGHRGCETLDTESAADDSTTDNDTIMSDTSRGAPPGTTRRRFLRRGATAVGVGAVGASGLAGVRAQSQPETIRLGGEISGWQGQAPDGIAGTTNPTLDLDPGTTYRVVWENLDGRGHNFALLDGDGEVLQRTEVMNEQGATQTIEFTVSEAMAEYVCEPHISSMNGTIAVGAGTTTATATTTESSEGEETEALIPRGATVRTETITEGTTTAPLGFEVPPNESGRYFIVDRVGQVYVHESGSLREEPFIDVSEKLAEITGEMGLLGMALHPNYRDNRRFYLRYSAPSREGTPEDFDHTEVLSEFTASEDGSEGLVDSERTLLEIPSPYDTHNSGAVTFGPDDLLYMGMGDGGGGHDRGIGHVADWYDRFGGTSGPDVSGNGQDVTENLLGSILRINVDRSCVD